MATGARRGGGSWKLLLLYATAAATRIYTVWNGGVGGVGGVGSIVPQSEKREGRGEEAVAVAIFPIPPTVRAADDLNSPPPPPHIRSPWCSTVQLLPCCNYGSRKALYSATWWNSR